MACVLFFSEQRPLVAQGIDVKELEPKKHRLEGALGDGQLIAQVKNLVLHLALAEPVR